MTVIVPSKYRQTMPGAFNPEDYIDFYENPFETLEQIQTAFREKEPPTSWATNLAEVQIDDVEWHKYTPPAALKKAPTITNQLLLDIVSSSIENVKAQAVEAERLKREAEEHSLADKDSLGPGKGKEPYLPIIIAPEKPNVEGGKGKEVEVPRNSSVSLSDSLSVPGSSKPEKRRRFALRRLFQRGRDKGESSTTGGAREVLRQLYETKQEEGGVDTSKPNAGFFSRVSLLKAAPEELIECVSCLDDFHPKEVIKVACHSYCRECFIRLITASVQNEQQWPPKCCLNEIPFRIILRFIPADLKKTFQDRSKEWEIPVSERIYCSQADCSLWVKPKDVDHSRSQGRCESGHLTCSICRGPTHGEEDCPQDNDMLLTNALAEDEGWRRCYNCKALVEHREACQHMTCRCGTQFCYVCGERWRTCSCSMQQLYDLKAAADTRREQRRFKEQSDAEELRQILLQIEEFEREEELKAELLRQEQERLEEEQRQRELEERVRQESIRRRDIEGKYKELRDMLDKLHELQQVMINVGQEQDAEDLVVEAKTTKEELAKKQETERSDLTTLGMAKLAEKENSLLKDYQIRAAEEHDIEEAYHERLKDFWKEHKDGDEEIEVAMLAFKRQMDHRQFAWEKWKKEQLARCQKKIGDERIFREELMYSAEHRLNDSYTEKELELTRRMAAEKMWLQLVILERERLLNESEVEEVEGDADSLFAVELGEENSVDAEQKSIDSGVAS
ncbi:Fc.00g068710.m01.CDS01 [Cosmosporella sp. VM-42]